MLMLMDHLRSTRVVGSRAEFCDKIGFQRTNLPVIRRGDGSFTVAQVYNAAKVFGVSADWLLGFTDDMHLHRSKPPMQRLREAVAAVENLVSDK